MSTNHATGRHYAAAGVDVIHVLAELSESINDLVGIPGIGQIATIVKAIIGVCDKVAANRTHAEFLGRRCHMLTIVIRTRRGQDHNSSEASSFDKFLAQTLRLVERIQTDLIGWSHLKLRNAVLMRREIGDIIIRYHGEIDLCLSTLQLVSAEETAQWQKQAKQAQEEDHVEIMEGISSILGTSMSTLQQVTEFAPSFTRNRMWTKQDGSNSWIYSKRHSKQPKKENETRRILKIFWPTLPEPPEVYLPMIGSVAREEKFASRTHML